MKPLHPIFAILFFLSYSCTALQAQDIIRCATDEAIQMQEQHRPGYKAAVDRAFDNAKQHALLNRAVRGADTLLRIPVVVHIVYKNQDENLPDSLVHSQIRILNEDYNRLNDDTALTRSVFDTLTGKANIEFYLAKIDPDGNPTTGITRTATTASSFDPIFSMDYIKFDSLGGINAWPAAKYLNIWVGDISFFGVPAVMGYAYPPANAPNWPQGQLPASPLVEGVVIYYAVFGKPNPGAVGPLSIVSKGRSCTHEVGHYFGLRHIWGDGGCTADDGIDDTPLASNNAQQTCTYGNTCVDAPFDFPDMIENFMDYAADSCMNMFTKEQIALMRSMIQTERSGLLWNADSTATDTTDTTMVGIYDFDKPAQGPEIRLHPNPSTGIIALNIDFGQETEFRVSVVNSVGRVVHEEPVTTSKSYHSHIRLQDEPAGFYIVKVSAINNSWHKKVILQ